MKHAVMFDMDGVLVNSEYCMRHSAILALREWGVDACHEDFIEFTGMGEDSFVGGVARKHGLEYIPAMKERSYELYDRLAPEEVEVAPGTKEMLRELRRRGYRLSVASAADHVKVMINLRCLGVSPEIFDAVTTGSEIVNKKPDPEIYLSTAARLCEDPADCVVVEDALAGIAAGRAAGSDCIGVTSTFTEQELLAAGAKRVVARTPLLLDIIDTL